MFCWQCRDTADEMLKAESTHLDNLKKMLESHLRLVLQQLQTLKSARTRLISVTNERSRVIDLLCYAVPSTGQQSAYVRTFSFAQSACPSKPTPEEVAPCAGTKLFRVEPLGPYTNECDQALEVGYVRQRCFRRAAFKQLLLL